MTVPARPIRALSEHLINQIAAGEVIERPASVIKELVENSLDAGATRIDIDLGEGGLDHMTVTDDGSGIAGHDLHAALRRHWTSKIAETSDLVALTSLGFRGEALASIAAVASVEIISRRREDTHGWRLVTGPGVPPAAPLPHQANFGTRITVRELFHQVPARRHFLKRARTEFLHIHLLARQLAFARPAVTFSLNQAGSRGLRLPAGRLGVDGGRWRSLFGSAFAEGAHSVSFSADGVTVSGWVAPPELAANQSDLQFLALNGRYIRDRQLAHAIRIAFGDAVPAGRFPAYALALDLAPAVVDVNVHPGKLEVRFAQARAVHDVLYMAVKRALDQQPARLSASAGAIAEAATAYRPAQRAPPAISTTRHTPVAVLLAAPLALIDDRYLLYRTAAAVHALDLRAAWAAILRRRLADDAPAPRPLLIPQRIAKGDALWRQVEVPALRARGFTVDDLGPAGWLVRAAPRVLPELPWAEFFERLTAVLADSELTAAVALAAAAVVELGKHGQPARRQLDALELGASAASLDLAAYAVAVDGELLRGANDARG